MKQPNGKKTESGRILGIILSGGQSKRMGGKDKALLKIGENRLVDIVYRALEPQVGKIAVSGSNDYGFGVPAIADLEKNYHGPLAGLIAAGKWAETHAPHIEAIMIAPVDSPGFPANLVARLAENPLPAVPEVGGVLQTAFGLWSCPVVRTLGPWAQATENPSLKRYCEDHFVSKVVIREKELFHNINCPEDLDAWKKYLKKGGNFINQ